MLERAVQPMRARDIHAAAEQLAGKSLRWTSVKAALAAGALGRRPRFQRVGYGVYQLAGGQDAAARSMLDLPSCPRPTEPATVT
jgi:hypothetical protein